MADSHKWRREHHAQAMEAQKRAWIRQAAREIREIVPLGNGYILCRMADGSETVVRDRTQDDARAAGE